VSCHEPPLVACAEPLAELDPAAALACGEELAVPAEPVPDEPEVSVDVDNDWDCVVPLVVATACVPGLLSAPT
jgi:hypothetical protein